MLIKDPVLRAEQARANREMLWNFLSIHTFSDLETMRAHVGFKTKAPVSKILSGWCKNKLVKKFKIGDEIGSATLFGITTKGLEGDTQRKAVQPSRISPRTLSHTLHCQKASSWFLKKEAFKTHELELVNIERGDLKKYNLSHRPDLLFYSKDEDVAKKIGVVCVEVELSLKSNARYQKILKDYFDNIDNRIVNQVIYVFYDMKLAKRFLNNILNPYIREHKVKKKNVDKFEVKFFRK